MIGRWEVLITTLECTWRGLLWGRERSWRRLRRYGCGAVASGKRSWRGLGRPYARGSLLPGVPPGRHGEGARGPVVYGYGKEPCHVPGASGTCLIGIAYALEGTGSVSWESLCYRAFWTNRAMPVICHRSNQP